MTSQELAVSARLLADELEAAASRQRIRSEHIALTAAALRARMLSDALSAASSAPNPA